MFIKFGVSVFLLALFLPSAFAQVPTSNSPLSEMEKTGRKLFLQRCEICHLSPNGKTLGPLLDGKLVAKRGDAAVRKQIMNGSAGMPGFQYGLEPAEIDKIIAFLKTITYKESRSADTQND